ncbi:hypothetical protein [Paraburkholderia phenoliruptrix]|uniref:Uncharacterized protein n=2 Tax=Paraburkholderia phenoliruptrix TaxID=252970 RepID=K0DZC0_9BURK|nr:hypothetical protein [Paraburkholderia phenoliruptrix]AFT89987.1 hypothetical protein BUPH_08222 [Paraburkholderia phenoliruptrix BR3459a]CAB4052452.1 hypothetical protein LMG9964_06142 [Paraburkholderia phenoliruptrix]
MAETYGQTAAARTMAINRFFDVVMRISEQTYARSRISRSCGSGYWTLVQYHLNGQSIGEAIGGIMVTRNYVARSLVASLSGGRQIDQLELPLKAQKAKDVASQAG